MMTVTTIIPKHLNDGKSIKTTVLNKILLSLATQFGGLTVEGETEGQWIDPTDGRHYKDIGLKVTVVCDRDRLREIEDAVKQIGRQLGQKAMYFEVRYFDGVAILKVD